jgi:hypothetical protein
MILRPIPNTDTYELAEDLEFSFRDDVYVVPKGFKTDGASVPRVFWSLSMTPFDPRVIRAAVIHDYIYSSHCIEREDGDRLFRKILLEDGTDPQITENMYRSVRDFGRFAWKRR